MHLTIAESLAFFSAMFTLTPIVLYYPIRLSRRLDRSANND